MNQLKTLCATLALSVLAACASTPAGQMVQMQGLVKMAAKAAVEEGDLSKEELVQLADALEKMAGDASQAGEVGAGSVSEIVVKALGWKGYKGAAVELALLQVDVLVAENKLDLSVGQYSEWLLAAAKAVKGAAE